MSSFALLKVPRTVVFLECDFVWTRTIFQEGPLLSGEKAVGHCFAGLSLIEGLSFKAVPMASTGKVVWVVNVVLRRQAL